MTSADVSLAGKLSRAGVPRGSCSVVLDVGEEKSSECV